MSDRVFGVRVLVGVGSRRARCGGVCVQSGLPLLCGNSFLAKTAVLPAMKSVSRRRPACLPIVHLLCIESIVGAIVVESTKGLEYYCSAPR